MMSRSINKIAAEGAAIRLHKKLRVKRPGQLVLDDVAMYLGVLVKKEGVKGSAARLVRRGQEGVIRLNSKIREPGARNFTIAHELGHWEIHENESQVFFCTSENFRDYRVEPMEAEANIFAAELLMPKFLFQQRIERVDPCLKLIGDMAEEFRTSLTATAIRFMHLSKKDCIIALIKEGKVVWSWQKEDSRGRGFLQKQQPVQAGSLAWELDKNGETAIDPSAIDSSAWFSHLQYPFRGELQEHSIMMPSYNSILTLLWLP